MKKVLMLAAATLMMGGNLALAKGHKKGKCEGEKCSHGKKAGKKAEEAKADPAAPAAPTAPAGH